jgi:GTPase
VMLMSGVSKQGVTEVLRALRAQIVGNKPVDASEDGTWQP